MFDRIQFNTCPLCDTEKITYLKSVDCSKHPLYNDSLDSTMIWNQCKDCAHIFTNGYYNMNACESIYSKTNEHQMVGYNIEQQRYFSARIIEKIAPYQSSGLWLDVGFGNGGLLFTAQEYGFKPIGLDIRLSNVNTMRAFGIDAYCEDICNFTSTEKFAVISMADVLEHIPYPKAALNAAKQLLIDNGVLFISMPNMESVLWSVLDKLNTNPYWPELEHYHNFSRTRLYSLLNECGLRPIKYSISERYRSGMEIIALNQDSEHKNH